MNEKRFELAYEQDDWWAVRDGDITLWKEEVVDLLNELSEENKILDNEKMGALSLLGEEIDKNENLKNKIQELEEKMNNDAFELYRHHLVSFGKAVELSAMSYREFIVYADKRGYGCELSL